MTYRVCLKSIQADPVRDLSLNLLDIVTNSLTAKADSIKIIADEAPARHTFFLSVTDNGVGMTPEQVKNAADPFYTTRKKRCVGLGLSLLKEQAEITGGTFKITSMPNKGTNVSCLFKTDSIDMTPIGKMCDTVAMLTVANPNVDFKYIRKYGEKEFTFDTKEIKRVLNGVGINNNAVAVWVKEYLHEQEFILYGGAISNENT